MFNTPLPEKVRSKGKEKEDEDKSEGCQDASK